MRFLATLSGHDIGRLIDIESLEMAGESIPVRDNIVFSPDEQILACCAMDGIDIRRVTNWSQVRRLTTRQGDVKTGQVNIQHLFSRDGRLLFALDDRDKRMRVWDLVSGRQCLEYPFPGSVEKPFIALHPDGKTLALGCDTETRLLKVETQAEAIAIAPHAEPIRAMTLATNGQTLACLAGGRPFGDSWVTAWPANETGRIVPIIRQNAGSQDQPIESSMAISSDRKWLAMTSNSNRNEQTILLMDLGGELKSIRISLTTKLTSNLSFGRDGNLWFGMGLELMSIKTGNERPAPERKWSNVVEIIAKDGNSNLRSLVHGNRLLAMGNLRGVVRVFDPAKHPLTPITEKTSSGNAISSLAFSPNDELLAVANDAGELEILTSSLNSSLSRVAAHRGSIAATIYLNQSTLITGGGDAAVRFWHHDGTNLTERFALNLPNAIRHLAVTPDHKSLFILLKEETRVRCIDLPGLLARFSSMGIDSGIALR